MGCETRRRARRCTRNSDRVTRVPFWNRITRLRRRLRRRCSIPSDSFGLVASRARLEILGQVHAPVISM